MWVVFIEIALKLSFLTSNLQSDTKQGRCSQRIPCPHPGLLGFFFLPAFESISVVGVAVDNKVTSYGYKKRRKKIKVVCEIRI